MKIYLVLGIVLIINLLMGCSIVRYHANADGSTDVSGYKLGNTTALDGAVMRTDGHGGREVQINGLKQDQVEGLKEVNHGLALIVEGLIKGAEQGVKP